MARERRHFSGPDSVERAQDAHLQIDGRLLHEDSPKSEWCWTLVKVRLNMHFALFLSLCLSVYEKPQSYTERLTDKELVQLIQKYDELDQFERSIFADELGCLHKIGQLRALCSFGDAYAITVLSRTLPSSGAIEFCKEFPAGSTAWLYALWGLSDHPRKEVAPYLREPVRKGVQLLGQPATKFAFAQSGRIFKIMQERIARAVKHAALSMWYSYQRSLARSHADI